MNHGNKKIALRRGGRPSRAEAGKLEDKIFMAARDLFFSEGYGTTSIEKITRRAQISKRTFYARFDGKAAVFRAVVHRILESLRPPNTDTDRLFVGKNTEEVLRRIAPLILHAALTPESLALHRLLLAETVRFPELAPIMNEQGARQEAIHRIAALMHEEIKSGHHLTADPTFAAEQFLLMLTVGPQRRALGLGQPMTVAELASWCEHTVDLFLYGYLSRKN